MNVKNQSFNKAGRLLEDKFYFDEDCLENFRHCRYFGKHFSVSVVFKYAKYGIYENP